MAARPHSPHRLLVVMAHPDDESLACGGTIALAARRGVEITLVCATRGERGPVNPSLGIEPGALAVTREHELREAAAVLGIGEVIIMAWPDGMLRWSEASRLEQDLAAVMLACRPEAVITFGPDGLYWHPDHIAIGRRTEAALATIGLDAALYYVSMPQGSMRGLVEAARRHSTDVRESLWGVAPEAFGAGALPPTLVVDAFSTVAEKLRALRCHRSQLEPDNPLAAVDVRDAAPWLGIEHLALAGDSRRRGSFLDALGTGPVRPEGVPG